MANDKNFIVKNGIQVGTTFVANDSVLGALSGASLTNLTAGNLSGTIPSGVLGNSKLSVHASTTSAELATVISDETGSGSLVFGTGPTLSAPIISGNTAFDTNTLFVDSVNNKVGLGTTAPRLGLHVAIPTASSFNNIGVTEVDWPTNFRSVELDYYGSGNTGTIWGITNSNLGVLNFQNMTNALIGTNGSTPLIFATLSLERMRIAGNGNVGIGTTTPGSLLTLAGSGPQIYFSDTAVGGKNWIIGPQAGTGDADQFGIYGNGGNILQYDGSANSMALYSNGSVRMYIDSAGNVGIGNTTPTQKLVVSGDTYLMGNVGIGVAPSSTSSLHSFKNLAADATLNHTNITTYDSNTTITVAREKTGIWNALINLNQNKSADGLTTYASTYVGGSSYVYNGNPTSGGDAQSAAMYGHIARTYNYANGANANTLTSAYGINSGVYQYGSGIISNAFGSINQIIAGNNSVTGNVTTAYGVYSAITSNTAMTIGTGYLYYGTHSGTTTTNKYGIYLTGETSNYFSGSVSVGGDVTITGNLTVNGTTTTINSTTISVDDKNIELGSVSSPTNTTADGGGITLKGTTDKTFNWVNATTAWTSSENMNLATGKQYTINNVLVANSSTLGSGITTSSLTQVGTIGTGVWQGTTIAGQYGGTGVINTGKTITLGGNISTANSFTTSGNYALTLTQTGATSLTLPTSGTVVSLDALNNFTANTITANLTGTSSSSNNASYLGGNYTWAAPAALGGTTANSGQFTTLTLTTNTATIGTAAYYVANGNFGIGTSGPTYTLEASGATKSIAVTGTGNPAFYAISSDAAGIPFITLQNGSYSWQNRNNGTAGDLSWAVNGSERMRITLGGNLVIGNGDTSATPISNILRATNGSGTDIAGASLTIQGGRGTGTGAGGSLIFSTSLSGTTGSSLNAATEAMRIVANGNIGIGTTSPAAKLDVRTPAGTAANQYIFTGSNAAAATLQFGQTGAIGWNTGITATDGFYQIGIDTGGVGYTINRSGTAISAHSWLTSGTEAMRIVANGNVGIGTTSPLAKVHSQVNTFTTADMVAYKAYNNQGVGVYANFQNSTTGTAITDGFLIGINDSEDVVLSNYEATNMLFSTNATEAMRIAANGNVGIGNTAPAQKLVVSGDTYLTGNVGIGVAPSSTAALFSSKTWASDASLWNTRIDTTDSNTAMTASQNKFGLAMTFTNLNQNKSSDGLTTYNPGLYGGLFIMVNGNTATGGNATGSLMSAVEGRVQNFANGSTSNTITTAVPVTGTTTQYGSGIITTAYGVKGTVIAGNNSVTGNVTTAYGVSSTITSNTAMTIGTGYLYQGAYSGATTTNKYGIYLTGETTNYFSGNTGIGTSTPGKKLDVNGDMVLPNNGILNFYDSGAVARNALQFLSGELRHGGAGAGLSTQTFYSSAVERMRIDASGNIGIGVAPSAWGSGQTYLQFGARGSLGQQDAGQIRLGVNYYNNGTNNIYIASTFANIYQQTSGEHRWLNAPSGTAGASIVFTQTMTLDASGNLGIGNTTPADKLSVTGTSNFTGNMALGANLAVTGTVTSGTWQGSIVQPTYGGTGKSTLPAAFAALNGFTTTATAAGTTALSNTSTSYQIFTGSTTQTITLPDTSTLAAGWFFEIQNNSTNGLTVNTSTSASVATVLSNTTYRFTCISIADNTAASWDYDIIGFGTATGSNAVVRTLSPTITTPSITYSTSAAVTAGTNAQGQGALTSDYNVVTTTAAAPSGVTLPTATVGRIITVVNKGTNAVTIYPASGGTIDALSLNAAITLPVNQQLVFKASSTTQWYSTYGLSTGLSDTATILATTRTLWGQNFNGSQNVTGSLTNVGDITGTGAVTLTATAATLALAATGLNIITLSTNAAERMRVLSSGQLLVGGSATALTTIPGSLGNSSVYSRAGMTVINDTTTLGYFQSYDSNATTDLKTWRHGGQDNGSYIFQTVNDAYNSSTTRLTISATGILSDGKGDVRAAPIQTKSGAYVVVASDAGQTIYISTGGVTINASILSAGDMITIVNNSASPQTITAGVSVTFRLAGTATTGARTLAQYGMATFLCVVGGATPTFICSGSGLT